MRLFNEGHHLDGVWITEERVRGAPQDRDLWTIRSQACKHAPGALFHELGDVRILHSRLLHLRNLGTPIDPEREHWPDDKLREYDARTWSPASDDYYYYKSKLINIQSQIRAMLHSHSRSQMAICKSKAKGVSEELLSGRWGGTGELEPSQFIINLSCLPHVLKTCSIDETLRRSIQKWNYIDSVIDSFGYFEYDEALRVGDPQNDHSRESMGKS